VLGPSDLYKLTKEIGKFIQNVRTLGSDLSTTFESNMESSLQLEELRKAQRELNDAFSFRRSINVDEDSEAFSVAAGSAQQAEEAAAAAAAPAEGEGGATKKRKIRRRVKRKPAPEVGAVPDLEMPAAASPETVATETKTVAAEPATRETTAEEIAKIEKEFDRFTNRTAEEEAEIEKEFAQYTEVSPAVAKAEQSRFQQQLSGNWNEQVLANEDKLEPIALVMNKIALLEKEKRAAQTRLEEEFEKRKELEEKYYEEQRSLLEEAAVQIQDAAFGLDSSKKV
jgi:Sec-independent protein translocase protein TatA